MMGRSDRCGSASGDRARLPRAAASQRDAGSCVPVRCARGPGRRAHRRARAGVRPTRGRPGRRPPRSGRQPPSRHGGGRPPRPSRPRRSSRRRVGRPRPSGGTPRPAPVRGPTRRRRTGWPRPLATATSLARLAQTREDRARRPGGRAGPGRGRRSWWRSRHDHRVGSGQRPGHGPWPADGWVLRHARRSPAGRVSPTRWTRWRRRRTGTTSGPARPSPRRSTRSRRRCCGTCGCWAAGRRTATPGSCGCWPAASRSPTPTSGCASWAEPRPGRRSTWAAWPRRGAGSVRPRPSRRSGRPWPGRPGATRGPTPTAAVHSRHAAVLGRSGRRRACRSAGPWAAGAAALLVAREVVRRADGGRPTRRCGSRRRLLGSAWARGRDGAGPGRRAAGRRPVGARAASTTPADLWRAEAAWWRRVERDGFALLRRPLTSSAPVIGCVAVLAADAWRVRAALEVAARGARRRPGRWRSSMPWRESLEPVRMQRVALVAPGDSLRDVLVEIAAAGPVELDVGRRARHRGRRRRLLQRIPAATGGSQPTLRPARARPGGRSPRPVGPTCSPARPSSRSGPRRAVVRDLVVGVTGWMPVAEVPAARRPAGAARRRRWSRCRPPAASTRRRCCTPGVG